MTRGRKANGGFASWVENQIRNTSLLGLAGILMLGAGFYWQTTYKLDQHAAALNELKAKAEETQKDETVARDKVRDAFAELNKQTAVMNTALSGLVRELERIGNKLEPPPSRSR